MNKKRARHAEDLRLQLKTLRVRYQEATVAVRQIVNECAEVREQIYREILTPVTSGIATLSEQLKAIPKDKRDTKESLSIEGELEELRAELRIVIDDYMAGNIGKGDPWSRVRRFPW